MNRKFRIIGAAVFIGVVLFALWFVLAPPARQTGQQPFGNTVNSAITNPVAFARTHFTGGVGALMMSDPGTGLPRINEVMHGSPAEKAGLRGGDVILQVDGVTTRGKTLSQVVESIRGFAAGSVTLTIQRAGSTNRQFIIRRTSWKTLGVNR